MTTSSIPFYCPVARVQVLVWRTRYALSGVGSMSVQIQQELDCTNEAACSTRGLLARCPVHKLENRRS
jgi:hypothetical protein